MDKEKSPDIVTRSRRIDPTNRYVIHRIYDVGLKTWIEEKVVFFTGRIIYYRRPTGDPCEIMSDGERCFRWPTRMILWPHEEWKNGKKS